MIIENRSTSSFFIVELFLNYNSILLLQQLNVKYTYALCKETIESIQKVIKMNIFDTLKTYTLLEHFLKSTVKLDTYKSAFIEWE